MHAAHRRYWWSLSHRGHARERPAVLTAPQLRRPPAKRWTADRSLMAARAASAIPARHYK